MTTTTKTTSSYRVIDCDSHEEISLPVSRHLYDLAMAPGRTSELRAVVENDDDGDPMLVQAPDCQGITTTLRIRIEVL